MPESCLLFCVCLRKRKRHPAARRGGEMQKHSAEGRRRAGVTRKEEPGRKDGEQRHGEKIHPVHTGAFRLTLGPAGANLTSIKI